MGRLHPLLTGAVLSIGMPAFAATDMSWWADYNARVAKVDQSQRAVYERYTVRSVMCVGDTLRMILTQAKAPSVGALLEKNRKTPEQLTTAVDEICDKVFRKRAVESAQIWDDVRRRFLVPLTRTMVAENRDTPLTALKVRAPAKDR